MAYTNKVKIEQYKKTFPTRLRNLMEEKRISQAELARLMQESGAKITSQAIGAYCRGETMPKLEYAQIIANCFNVSLDYLSGYSDVQSRDETTQLLNKETNLSENACETLKELKYNPYTFVFIDALLRGSSDELEDIAKIYMNYKIVKNAVLPSVKQANTRIPEGMSIEEFIEISIEGKNMGKISFEKLEEYSREEYSRFELWNAFIKLADNLPINFQMQRGK